jgi:undecaprenyl-phosphate galactose phosphotransferase/putative colanic acid biosynthesis UDP-glucose lipid carrier transferase
MPFWALPAAVAAGDWIAISTSSVFGSWIYQLAMYEELTPKIDAIGLAVLAAIVFSVITYCFGLYRSQALLTSDFKARHVSLAFALTVLLVVLMAFLLKVGSSISRGSMVAFALSGVVALPAWRLLAIKWAHSAVRVGMLKGRRVVIIGTKDEMYDLEAGHLLRQFGISEISRFALSPATGRLSFGAVDAGAVSAALECARVENADYVALALPWNDARSVELLREHCRASALPVRLLPDRSVRRLSDRFVALGHRGFCIEIQRGPLSSVELLVKRTMDVAFSGAALFLAAPLMVMVAVAVKLDSAGPVIFRQRRHGFNGREFKIFKFRTMTVLEDGATVVQAQQADRRVTRVGRVLRETSLDELPQLLNVLLGDMSFIGPRPHALAHNHYYESIIADYAFRHHVKPGITGWAQVNGCRGETARIEQMHNRVQLDLWYINNWAVLLDLKILLRTCLEVVRKTNAY